ncbi:uncharacterized protein LOC141598905 isoform X2 [Silene latifolia]|uniref:uncharacterized protein LOC141598905 isoform X2 n=1 Tax=Silene latifolia TaxID=37657 RepID=UPI003D788CD1
MPSSYLDFPTLVSPQTSGGSSDANEPEDSRKREINDGSGSKPRKRLRLARDWRVNSTVKDATEIDNVIPPKKGPLVTVSRIGGKVEAPPRVASVGSVVEVLSQDSGMRGCWFRATVIKKHKNKVKLSYHDIKDAENEANCLEEWVLASRIAVRDEMGLRLHGRTMIRPSLAAPKGKISWAFNVGTIVDAWQHDGWWEGVVIQKQPGENFRVYFPGEKLESVFGPSDLRHSQEWMENTWKELGERPDVAASILSGLGKEETAGQIGDMKAQIPTCDYNQPELDSRKEVGTSNLHESNKTVPDLLKDDFLSQLKWKTLGKRKRTFFSVQRLHPRASRVNSERTLSHKTNHKVLALKVGKENKETNETSKVGRDKFKFKNESLFNSSVIPPPLTSLVMSR